MAISQEVWKVFAMHWMIDFFGKVWELWIKRGDPRQIMYRSCEMQRVLNGIVSWIIARSTYMKTCRRKPPVFVFFLKGLWPPRTGEGGRYSREASWCTTLKRHHSFDQGTRGRNFSVNAGRERWNGLALAGWGPQIWWNFPIDEHDILFQVVMIRHHVILLEFYSLF